MKIAIIGIGTVGSALARGLKKSSHKIVLGARDITNKSARDLAAEVGAGLASPAEAANSSELMILALPWDLSSTA
jgi:predicted dinucleotide-binding enzyme